MYYFSLFGLRYIKSKCVICNIFMRRYRKFRQGRRILKIFVSSKFFIEGRTDLPREACLWPNCLLRKHIASYYFPGGTRPMILKYTLCKISYWSPYMFYASFESNIRLYKIHASINQPRFFRDMRSFYLKMTGTYRRC